MVAPFVQTYFITNSFILLFNVINSCKEKYGALKLLWPFFNLHFQSKSSNLHTVPHKNFHI